MTQPSNTAISFFQRAFLVGVEDVTQLVFVRHGEATYTRSAESPEGAHEPALTERGLRQADLVGERFSTDRVEAVYVSPLRRAYETGAAIAKHHKLEPIVVPDLREVELFRDMPRDRPPADAIGPGVMMGIWQRMLRERSWDVFPLSESSFDFRKRVVNAIEGIIIDQPGKRVVIACHGGVINTYLAHILGVREDLVCQPANTSVTIVNAGEGIRALQTLNDAHHLMTAEGSFLST